MNSFNLQLLNVGYDNYTSEPNSPRDSRSRAEKTQEPVIDILPQLYDIGSSDSRGPSTGMWSRTLRLKITGRDGIQKIDARIPVSNHLLDSSVRYLVVRYSD